MAIEKPKYEVVEEKPDLEVRQYGPSIVAETEVSGDFSDIGREAFSRLAGYIFGNNEGQKKIAMTAPVTQTPAEGMKIAMTAPVTQQGVGPHTYRVDFTMPSEYTLQTLPAPKDSRVHLRTLEPKRYAAIRYHGTWSQKNYDQHLAALRAAMQREGLTAEGEPVWARYDPPYKPWFLRTNEILIPVATH